MGLEKLDEKGFVFLDARSEPYRCAMWGNEAWLFRWNHRQHCWVSLRPITQSEIWDFPRNLTQEQQDMYYA
jgi:hypothetical protein